MTLRNQLINFFKQEKYEVHSGRMERVLFKTKTGGNFKPASISRQARLLAEEGIIQKRYEKGSVIYWYEQNKYEKMHESIKGGRVEVDLKARQVKLI